MKEKRLRLLRSWQDQKNRKQMLKTLDSCDEQGIKFLCECALNIINGNIPFQVEKLIPFEKQLKHLCDETLSCAERRKLLTSVKGIKLLQLISRPCYCYLTE